MILEVKNLHVGVEGKDILKGVSFKLEKGKIYALMGPNGSGKSTLAEVLMGNPKYKIVSGKIIFNGKDVTNISPDKRAKLGMFLSFQHPVEFFGISVTNFLKQAYNSIKETKITLLDFKKKLKENSYLLEIDEKFLERHLNKGFSGGEKKKLEMLQLVTLEPKLAILDETDSGLDIDSLKAVSESVNTYFDDERTVLIITHYSRILEYVRPDEVFVMIGGEIIYRGDPEIVEEIENKGYKIVQTR